MLYEQIRHADIIRKIYRLRHLLTQKNPPDLGSKLGYPKYSKQFYRVKAKLREEGILNKQGRFVESLLNLHVVEMPLHATKEQIDVLGNQVPYSLFLALIVDSPKKAGEMIKDLRFSRKAVYDSLEKMEKVQLVNMEDSLATVKEGPVNDWLVKYLELVKTSIDTTGNISLLFNTIPAYISGPQAYYTINYEPGRPVGPADMLLLTYPPFLNFLETMVRHLRYFEDYPKKVEVRLSKDGEIIWIDRIPYDKNAKEIWR